MSRQNTPRAALVALALALLLVGCGSAPEPSAPRPTGDPAHPPAEVDGALGPAARGDIADRRLSDLIGDLRGDGVDDVDAVVWEELDQLPLECGATVMFLFAAAGELARPADATSGAELQALRDRLRPAVPDDLLPTLDAVERVTAQQVAELRRSGAATPSIDDLLDSPSLIEARVEPLRPHVESLDPWIRQHCGGWRG